jgi:hypothetical protein
VKVLEVTLTTRIRDPHRPPATASPPSPDTDCLDAGAGPAGEPADDCNDGYASIYPGATEVVGDGIEVEVGEVPVYVRVR